VFSHFQFRFERVSVWSAQLLAAAHVVGREADASVVCTLSQVRKRKKRKEKNCVVKLENRYCRIANEAQEDEDYDQSIFEAGIDA
jgi:hypothetical protein